MIRLASVLLLVPGLAACSVSMSRTQPMVDGPAWDDSAMDSRVGEEARQRSRHGDPLAQEPRAVCPSIAEDAAMVGADPITMLAALAYLVARGAPPQPVVPVPDPRVLRPEGAQSLLDMTDEAIRRNPSDPAGYDARARILDALGWKQRAAADRARAQSLRPPPTPPAVEP